MVGILQGAGDFRQSTNQNAESPKIGESKNWCLTKMDVEVFEKRQRTGIFDERYDSDVWNQLSHNCQQQILKSRRPAKPKNAQPADWIPTHRPNHQIAPPNAMSISEPPKLKFTDPYSPEVWHNLPEKVRVEIIRQRQLLKN